ncbi:PrpF domain-containing protein [Vibrio sp. M60_M31a]
MRAGTSKKAHTFVKRDLQLQTSLVWKSFLLLAAMGSPDERQIDGVGGADPLTSKVAIVCAI